MNRRSLALATLSAVLLVTPKAHSATFAVRSDRDLVHRADAIVIATARQSYSALSDRGGIETITPVIVEEVIKGDIADPTVNVVEPGGVFGGVASRVAGAPQFPEGRRLLLFLMRTGPARWSVLDLAVGKFTFAEDTLGQRVLVRDEDEIAGYDSQLRPYRETRRSAPGFLQFVRTEAHGGVAVENYVVPAAELTKPLAPERPGRRTTANSLEPQPLVAPYTATSYSMVISGSMGSRWSVFPGGVSFYMGATQEPGAPGGGATAVQTGINSWDNDCASNVNYVYAGADDGSHTGGLHTADGRNTVLFERDLSSYGIPAFTCSGNGYSGTLGVGGITSASGTNTVGGETFVSTQEGDVEMNRGLANCTTLFNNGDFNSAVTHELGHTLGFRHADQDRNSSGACSNDPSLECSSTAIMKSVIPTGLNAALQSWDQHAVQAIYPGGTCGGCTLPTVSISASATSITAGQSVTLSSSTTGNPTSFQWYVGTSGNTAQPVSGGNGSTLTVAPPATTSYWLRVTNSCGSANSNTVTITVSSPPPRSKAKSDFNADGRSDLVLQNSSTSGITVWLMNGTAPSVGAQIAAPAGYVPRAAGDIDGDGHADVIVQNPSTGDVNAYLMNADGVTVKQLVHLTNPGAAYKVLLTADFDRDGTDDIILQNDNGLVSIWLMKSGAISTGYALAWPDAQWRVLGAGDFDGDGFQDIILQSSTTAAVSEWHIVNAQVSSGQVINQPPTQWGVIAAGDVNGDGKDDVILQDRTTGNVTVWIMNGFQITNGHVVGAPGVSWVVKGRGDFNGDGTSDIVLQDSSTKSVVVWLMSAGSLSVSGPPNTVSSVYNLMVNR